MSDRPWYRLHVAAWLVILASLALFIASQIVPQPLDLGNASDAAYGWPNVGHVTFTGGGPLGWWGLRFDFRRRGLPYPFQVRGDAFVANLLCFVPFTLACTFLIDWWLRRRLCLVHFFWLLASAGVVFAFWVPDLDTLPGAAVRFGTAFRIALLAARICFVFWAGWLTARGLRAAGRIYVEANFRAVAAVVDAAVWCHAALRRRACATAAGSLPHSQVGEDAP